jgi:hypothetical protein
MENGKEILEIFNLHHSNQKRYIYFLLAVNAAAIGFTVQKLENYYLSWWLLPVACAIITWGISFYFGCKTINWVQAALYANYNLLRLKNGTHPEQPNHPQLAQAAIEGVDNALNDNAKKTDFYGVWQFRTLILGAVLFIIWQILELIHKSIPS